MAVELVYRPAGVPVWRPDADWARELPLVQALHQSLPGYQPTPLVELPGLAGRLGVKRLFVKDESQRLGLQAFKVLGAAYAVARLLAEQLQLPALPDWPELAAVARQRLPGMTLVTATDGNHGRGVAWVARSLGLRAVVYLPAGAANGRVQAIQAAGGEAIVTDLNYDDAVRLAAQAAADQGWWLIQDTAWPGYQQVPAWIIQGYTTLAVEADRQLQAAGATATHLLLQAGVGALAAAMQTYWLSRCGPQPVSLLVEPERAACFYRSVQVGDGQPHAVAGDLATIMAGLACGEPNPLAWPVLSQTAAAFASCPDYVAALGMRLLAAPIAGDPSVEAGESGAVGLGLLALLLCGPTLQEHRQRLGLGADSTVLLLNSEGATDSAGYQRVVWGGEHPLPAGLIRWGGEQT